MKKIAAVLGPLVAVIMMVPFLAALMVTAIAGPAAGQELKAIACAGSTAASGSWRPPFQQGYLLTSGFGMRFDPISHQWKLHTGQDLASQPGPGPVVAAAGGKVVSAGTMSGYGNAVVPAQVIAFSSCPAAGLAIAVTIRAVRNGTIMIITTMGPRTAAIFFIGAAISGERRQYSWELLGSYLY